MNYKEYSPQADKLLRSDGSITDFAGNIIEAANAQRAQMYIQMSPNAAKWLLSDGTISEHLPTSGSGGSGTNGWSPRLAVTTDNERRILRVADWTGGSGVKPAAGMYIGSSGFTADISEAVDIRGSMGQKGEKGDTGHLKKEIVTSLPDAGGADVNTVYMVLRNPAGEQGDIYDEYMVIGGEWELIGNTAINLNEYLKTADAENTYLKISEADKSIATQSANGLMSAVDKTKLDIVSNENILINSDYRKPVNQRQLTKYTTTYSYTIDGWFVVGDMGSVTVEEDGIVIEGGSTGAVYFIQRIENPSLYSYKTFTLSWDIVYKIGTGDVIYGLFGTGVADVIPATFIPAGAEGIISKSGTAADLSKIASGRHFYVQIAVLSGSKIKLRAAKLELGSISTLANDPPVNYGVELAKCQRYYYQISSTSLADIGVGGFIGINDFYGVIPIPVSMRVKPTIAYSSLKDITLRANGTVLASTTSVVPEVSTNTSIGLRIQGNVGVRGEWGNIRLPANAWIAFDAEIY